MATSMSLRQVGEVLLYSYINDLIHATEFVLLNDANYPNKRRSLIDLILIH